MVEQACKESELVYGTDDDTTRDVYLLRADIIESSYNTAKSHGMEDVPDGTSVAIKLYSRGRFGVSVTTSETPSEDDCEARLFRVLVEQVVIMDPDSDVVLHSLKGAKHLNGELGTIIDFNDELGRYEVILEGSSKTVNVKPQNLLPAYMGCEKEEMINLALGLSLENDYIMV